MDVSVVVTSYDIDRYEDLQECVESLLNQDYPSLQVVLVLEDSKLVDRIGNDFADSRIKVEYSEENLGLSKARNKGASIADGDFLLFTDDDIIARDNWVSKIIETYESKKDAFGVGGKAEPIWPKDKKPTYIPPEFYWIFGVTHKHHPSKGKVRNTFGCNIGFNRELFLDSGGLNDDLGKKHGTNIQGEETEVCHRIQSNTGRSFYYNPEAIIEHKVYEDQLKFSYMINRCFWQGYTKRVMKTLEDESINHEKSYLRNILVDSSIHNMKNTVSLNAPTQHMIQTIMIFIFTFFVGLGFMYGKVKYRT